MKILTPEIITSLRGGRTYEESREQGRYWYDPLCVRIYHSVFAPRMDTCWEGDLSYLFVPARDFLFVDRYLVLLR